jgi:hemoglobin
MTQSSLYAAVGGRAAVLRLAEAWHRRCLADPVAAHPFSHPIHPQHVERLAAYWTEALGGPSDYSGRIADHSHVVRLHAGCGGHEELDRRVLACFTAALDDADLPEVPGLRETLAGWFAEMITAMDAYPESSDDVPSGLPMPVHAPWPLP